MANIFDPSDEIIKEWDNWVNSKSEKVKKLASQVKPWKLYKLKSSGHKVTIYSIDEPEDEDLEPTFKVNVLAQFNFVVFERRVFGIKLEDLEETDLPEKDEMIGSLGDFKIVDIVGNVK